MHTAGRVIDETALSLTTTKVHETLYSRSAANCCDSWQQQVATEVQKPADVHAFDAYKQIQPHPGAALLAKHVYACSRNVCSFLSRCEFQISSICVYNSIEQIVVSRSIFKILTNLYARQAATYVVLTTFPPKQETGKHALAQGFPTSGTYAPRSTFAYPKGYIWG